MRLRTLALGAVLSAGGGAAVAQQAPQVPNVAHERQWNVDARLAAYYETNIAHTGKAVARSRGIVPEDVRITPQIAADIVQPIGQSALFLNGVAGYDFHNRNDRLDRARYQVTGGGTGVIGICRPILYGTYSGLQSDLADLNLVTVENEQVTKGVSAGVQCGRPVGLNGGATVQRFDTKNSADRLVVQDHTAETLFVQLGYGSPNLVNASLFYSYANNEYPNRVIVGRPIGDGFFTETVGLQLQRRFGPRLTTGGSVSATRLKREFAPAGTKQKITATTYAANASYRAGSRLELNMLAAKNVRPSDRPGKLFDVAESLEGSARYRLGGRFNVVLGHVYQDVVSNVDTLQAGLVVTNSRLNATYGQFEVRRVGNGSVTLDVRHERRDTNLPSFNYTSTRVGLITSYSF
ncbi:hypothetical protein [Phenylobacterium sp.]|uniref:hypothetical protein n=1 Tax=Phenylobacterium sp. TaxID=1871053 RepID=UPI002ED9044D